MMGLLERVSISHRRAVGSGQGHRLGELDLGESVHLRPNNPSPAVSPKEQGAL